jgi:hypothetical protein
MNHDEHGPMENLLEGVEEHADILTYDELKTELLSRGIDVDTALQDVNRMIAALEKEERLGWMKVADERKSSLLVAETPESTWLQRSAEEVMAAFKAYIGSATPETALAFRNKGILSVEDMAQILEANEILVRRRRGEEQSET